MTPFEELPRLPTGAGFSLLGSVRVLDLTTSIAGPYATMLLGDFGAEVVKVERPGGGDDARHWGPPFLNGESLWFLSVNRNKESLALDYSRPEGHALLLELVARSDVVVLNQLPRQQARLRTDYRTLKTARPDLIHVSLTGFGLEGASADRPCYDLVAEGLSGVMDLTGEAESDPQKIGTPAADLLAGMDAALATVAALFERQRSGRGCQIDVSLVESMTRLMTPRLVSYLGSGELPRRSGARDSVLAIYQAFQTADAPITLGIGNDAIWRRFCGAIGEPGMAEDPRFATNAERRRARAQLVARIQDILNTRGRDHWLALFAEHGIPAGPIQRIDEVAADPGLRARGLFYRMAREDGGEVPQVNTGVHIDGEANAPRRPPPVLGEHSADVLRSVLGKSDDDVARLRAAGII
ncbi:MAG TPA: CoA transferase [Geminicoccaceae bacterium]|jgi:crotonobetainyl-CoA:carnitine CoA-transferase CaiB-like acyl-CoA transferase|nr:CoA transferase [Geminicoccaceae bacterium]